MGAALGHCFLRKQWDVVSGVEIHQGETFDMSLPGGFFIRVLQGSKSRNFRAAADRGTSFSVISPMLRGGSGGSVRSSTSPPSEDGEQLRGRIVKVGRHVKLRTSTARPRCGGGMSRRFGRRRLKRLDGLYWRR